MVNKALNLALAVYRLTKLFPEGEVLIGQMRKTANQALADLIVNESKKALAQIKILLSYFKIARKQEWTKAINFVILGGKYRELLKEVEARRNKGKGDFSGVKKTEKKIQIEAQKKFKQLSLRQRKILALVKEKKVVQAKDLSGLFPNLNVRTIRRDLQDLIKYKFVFQKGRGRASFYRIYRTNADI